MPRATGLIAAILLFALPFAARAQDFTVNGLLDLGFATTSHQTSWLKGGLGKLDSGGGGGGGGQSVAFVGQALADLRLQLDPALAGFVRLRLAPNQHAPFDILEAYARYQPVSTRDWLWSVKLGAFFPPISLENESVGWTSPWTLTPSAINSWVGDELRTIGGESNLEWRYGTGALSLLGSVPPGRCSPIAAGRLTAGRSGCSANPASPTSCHGSSATGWRCARNRSRSSTAVPAGMPAPR
jgi:hypothetical protein